jgi:hypothetical protein
MRTTSIGMGKGIGADLPTSGNVVGNLAAVTAAIEKVSA